MQVFHTESKIIITCNKRLSPYLQREVEALGYEPVRVFPTGVELKGTVTDTIPLKHQGSKIKVLSTAELFAKAIVNVNEHGSISQLFKVD